ncbi:unnamed protein product [Lymnaea stagnalis]|uniref:Secreted protein n=1 Tax=Lymnaea stagnalis TaxID=6523 RepID=A0AAV2HDK8_LYMST
MAIKYIAAGMICILLANCAQMVQGKTLLRQVLIPLFVRMLDGCIPKQQPRKTLPDYPPETGSHCLRLKKNKAVRNGKNLCCSSRYHYLGWYGEDGLRCYFDHS